MNLKKIKKYIIIINLAVIALLLPLTYGSSWLQANLLKPFPQENSNDISAKHTLHSEENFDFKIYDNFASSNDPLVFQKTVIANIKKAKQEIIIAMYAFDLTQIKLALLDAKNRGVKVTLIYSKINQESFEKFWSDANAISPIYIGENIPNERYSMHHKFMIIDPDSNDATLLTGPWNWSFLQQSLDPNLLFETHNKKIIQSYLAESQRLISHHNGSYKFTLEDFRPWMDNITFADNTNVEIWFSPGREKYSIENRILSMINSADHTIDISNTLINSIDIGKAIVKKAKEGLKIRVILDRMHITESESIYPYLQKIKSQRNLDNLDLIVGGKESVNELGQHSIYHNHTLIIDDHLSMLSSANWSYGGFFLNDENTLIIDNTEIAHKLTDLLNLYLKSL